MPHAQDERKDALAALLSEVRFRPRWTEGLPGVGHYAGFVRAGKTLLAITTDTVGTKVMLAEQLNRWEEVGEDLVSINTNDLAAVGARPLGIVDSLSIPYASTSGFRALGRGMNRALRAAGCGLLGGETAIVPALVRHPDLGATAIGDFPRGRSPVTGASIRPGDLLVGLKARGFHSNGYTLIRRVLRRAGVNLRRRRPGAERPLGEELLESTRPYVAASGALAGLRGIHGLAHITGGGVRNLVRLRESVRFVLDEWPTPEGVYAWMAEAGRIPSRRLYETFNMGIGFVIVLDPEAWKEVRIRLRRASFSDAYLVGHVAPGSGVELPRLGLRYQGYA